MNKTEAKNLLRLATLLEKDAENKTGATFDMSHWAIPNYERIEDSENWNPNLSCDTVACAWGAGALSGIFKKQGVTWNKDNGHINIRYLSARNNMEAAKMFFGLTNLEASWLFGGNYYPNGMKYTMGASGEKHVAKRLRTFVEKKQASKKLKLYPYPGNGDKDRVKWVQK